MAFAGAALVFGKHVNFGGQKAAIGLFARSGAQIHAGENIGKFNRHFPPNHGLIRENQPHVTARRRDNQVGAV